MLLCGVLSQRANIVEGDVVFNNTRIEDLMMNSSNQTWWGSCERSPTFMMGFLEWCSPSGGLFVKQNI
jgi:hypothetical protein